MCGRFVFLSDQDREQILAQMPDELVAMEGREHLNPRRGDIFPSQSVPVIVESEDHRPKMEMMRWGYPNPVDEKKLLINARSETADKKPTFRRDFRERRCLIPATGFYEWNPDKDQFEFSEPGKLLYLGGIWRPRKDEPEKDEFLILTKEPDETVRPIHNRMPVLIPPDETMNWLNNPDMRDDLLKAPASLSARPKFGEQLSML